MNITNVTPAFLLLTVALCVSHRLNTRCCDGLERNTGCGFISEVSFGVFYIYLFLITE